jgi:DNA processing protein
MVEVSEKSGSLITARMALEQGREAFAVPGSPLSEVSKGCHRMIRQGAVLVTDVAQVMEEMDWTRKVDHHPKQETTNLSYKVPKKGLNKGPNSELYKAPISKLGDEVWPKLSPVSQRVLKILSPYTMSMDEISLAFSDDIQNISQSLVELQLAGFVQQRLGEYIRVS